MDTLYQRKFTLQWSAVSEIRQVLKHVLTALSVRNSDIDSAGLVSTEYLTNLIRHNMSDVIESLTLKIYRSDDKKITLEFIDNLEPYDLFANNDSNWDIGSGELVEGGMGVALIRHYYPKASYRTYEEYNYFSFTLQNIDKRPTLIYIDDDKSQLALLEAYLTPYFQVITCLDIESGWQAILTSGATILLLDHKLKQGTCEPLLKKLNQSNLKMQLSVVMLTGDDSEEVIRTINHLGVDDYLIKPVKKMRLLQSIERVIHRFSALKYYTSDNQTPAVIDIENNRKARVFGSITTNNGGDFCMLPEHELQPIVLGDMMGHGLQALKESFAVKGFISGYLSSNPSLTSLLPSLNKALYDQKICKSSIVTLLIAFINNNRFYWLNAGHPSPVIITKKGEIIDLKGTDPLLGLSKDHHYKLFDYPMDDIEHILLYTDGWLENRETQQDDITSLRVNLPGGELAHNEYAEQLWRSTQVSLTKEIDDASLIVIS
ncbi:SpoIIE family protein phosphatase [Pseudoalteromonas sp. NEC-BIFX-2020_015]|uniref:SpoIIE family protein phosphatase n=1 Tax=Pseudoalteromonas sp. NEC-BIFX-2020_015 TaxID=2729544 RepID=UPI0014614DBE|nr:SpoIIE family protein phosphatase [Pseudoalteromonas sp. NEC-BIFX-2020_015]NMR24179.1 SpoIIE family protein phosphatase [Pseudoalteromonas sp. NEC-BIFX-2020_015]